MIDGKQKPDDPIPCLPMICPRCGEAGFEGTLELLNHVGDHLADLTITENDLQEKVIHQSLIIDYLAGWVVELYGEARSDGYATKDWTREDVLDEVEEQVK